MKPVIEDSILDSITDEDHQRWSENLETFIQNGHEDAEVFRDGFMQQLWNAGEWLGEQIGGAGGTQKDQMEVCFAAGQTFFGCDDPWPLAVEALRKYVAGTPDKPGLELARKLAEGMLGKG